MTTFVHTIQSLWQVLVIGLLFGAGVPIVVAFGIRFLAPAEGCRGRPVRRPLQTTAGYACFTVAVVAVLLGIAWIMKDFLATDLGIHIFYRRMGLAPSNRGTRSRLRLIDWRRRNRATTTLPGREPSGRRRPARPILAEA